jgi:hypothetical protein
MKQMEQLKVTYEQIQKVPSGTARRLMLEGLREELAEMHRALEEKTLNNNDK